MSSRYVALAAVCLPFLLIAAAASPSIAQQRQAGVLLLEGEQWEEAGELLGTYPRLLIVVQKAWNAHEDWHQERRDKYRFQLARFFFQHADLITIGWPYYYHREIQGLAESYNSLQDQFPELDAGEPLDLSHEELFSRDWILEGDALEERRAEVAGILRTKPDSIPALSALRAVLYVERSRVVQSGEGVWHPPTEKLNSPRFRLAMAREAAAQTQGTGYEAEDALENGWHLAPSRHQQAFLLNRLAEFKTYNDPGKVGFIAARRVFEKFPETPAASTARALAATNVTEAKGPDRAVRYLRIMQARGEPHTRGLDQAWFAVSVEYKQIGRMDDAIASLNEIIRLYPDKTTSSRAMLGLAEVYLEMGDEDQELHWLERCASFDKTEATNRNIMDTDSTQSVAIQRLADRYQQRDRWGDALRMWLAWKPTSWCGNCAQSMALSKTRAIVRCQLRLRQYAPAATTALTYLSQTSDQEMSATVFVLYAHSGQLADLRRISQQLRQASVQRTRASLDDHGFAHAPVEEMYISTRHLELLLRLNELAEQNDQEGLLAAVTDALLDSWQSPTPLWDSTVAKILSSGVKRDAQVIAGLLRSLEQFERIPVRALAECDSAEADAMLRDFLNNGVPRDGSRVFLQEVAGALLDQGDRGRFLVERMAHGRRTRGGTHAAKTALQSRTMLKQVASNHDFVRLAANSLPRVMPVIE